jgi:dihydroorotase
MITTNPSRVIGRSDELGSLAVGRAADVSVYRVIDTPTRYYDGEEEITGQQRLTPVGCIRGGRWMPTSELATYDACGLSRR